MDIMAEYTCKLNNPLVNYTIYKDGEPLNEKEVMGLLKENEYLKNSHKKQKELEEINRRRRNAINELLQLYGHEISVLEYLEHNICIHSMGRHRFEEVLRRHDLL